MTNKDKASQVNNNQNQQLATLEAKLDTLAQMVLTEEDYQVFLQACGAISNIIAADRDKVRQMLPDPPPGEDGAPEH